MVVIIMVTSWCRITCSNVLVCKISSQTDSLIQEKTGQNLTQTAKSNQYLSSTGSLQVKVFFLTSLTARNI